MPKKSARGKSSADAEGLTLELTRRLKKPRASKATATKAPAAAEPAADPAVEAAAEAPRADAPKSDAVAELMKRYDRSRPRKPKLSGEDEKE